MKDKIEDLVLTRVNISIEEDCKQWYMFKARSMGMSMANLMAYVLSNFWEQHITADAVRLLSEMSQGEDLKKLNSDTKDILQAIQNGQYDITFEIKSGEKTISVGLKITITNSSAPTDEEESENEDEQESGDQSQSGSSSRPAL